MSPKIRLIRLLLTGGTLFAILAMTALDGVLLYAYGEDATISQTITDYVGGGDQSTGFVRGFLVGVAAGCLFTHVTDFRMTAKPVQIGGSDA